MTPDDAADLQQLPTEALNAARQHASRLASLPPDSDLATHARARILRIEFFAMIAHAFAEADSHAQAKE